MGEPAGVGMGRVPAVPAPGQDRDVLLIQRHRAAVRFHLDAERLLARRVGHFLGDLGRGLDRPLVGPARLQLRGMEAGIGGREAGVGEARLRPVPRLHLADVRSGGVQGSLRHLGGLLGAGEDALGAFSCAWSGESAATQAFAGLSSRLRRSTLA